MSEVKFKRTITLGKYQRADLGKDLIAQLLITINVSKIAKFVGQVKYGGSANCVVFGQMRLEFEKHFIGPEHIKMFTMWRELHMAEINEHQYVELKNHLQSVWGEIKNAS